MLDADFRDELLKQLEQLSGDQQRRVLDFAHSLTTFTSQPIPIPGKKIIRFAGTLTSEEAKVMKEAIDSACEQVNPNEW